LGLILADLKAMTGIKYLEKDLLSMQNLLLYIFACRSAELLRF